VRHACSTRRHRARLVVRGGTLICAVSSPAGPSGGTAARSPVTTGSVAFGPLAQRVITAVVGADD
jgi:hypothetical protein